MKKKQNNSRGLANAIKEINERFGDGSIMKLGKARKVDVDAISTGSISLDIALGVGGIPRGRIIEIFGPEGCLCGDTFIQYDIRDVNGNRINHKGGSIKMLYERFNNISNKKPGRHLRTKKKVDFYVSSINKDGFIIKNKVADVVKSGIKECFEMTTFGGHKLICTKDHKLYIGNNKYIPLEKLKAGNDIYVHENTPYKNHAIENDLKLRYVVTRDKIMSIEYLGDIETYDIKCYSPNNNYIANGIVVHNSGKTTLSLHIITESQKMGDTVAFIDAEHALDPEYAKRIGVNIDDLNLSQPSNGEQALQIVEILIKSGDVKLIVVDSVAALTPKAEIDGSMDDQQIGLQARLMSKAMRKLAGLLSRSNVSILFINQIRMKIGMMFGNPETTPGGRALKFYSSVRIDLRRKAKIKKGNNIIGSRVKAKIPKNKVAPPFKIAEFDILHSEGISLENDLINIGVENNIIKRTGSFYYYGKEKLGQGLEKAGQHLKEKKELKEKIKNELLESIKESNKQSKAK